MPEIPAMEQVIVPVESIDNMVALFGAFDENLRVFEEELGVRIRVCQDGIRIEGDTAGTTLAKAVIEQLLDIQRSGEAINRSRIRYAIDLARDGNADLIPKIMGDVIAVTSRGRQVKCKTLGQKRYVQALRQYELCFGVGPAGTGKTYLAVANAVLAIKNKEVDKIILTRPAVEAGEKLGFLPGDLQAKVDPYLRPLYDALEEFLGLETFKAMLERGAIEIAPLAYMRGRTLTSAYIILDEAQNCSVEQMKMFLTRIGEGSRVVVTGDVTQIDLPRERKSGLMHAIEVLDGVEGISVIKLTHKDVVRHELVQRIIKAYEKYEQRGDRNGN